MARINIEECWWTDPRRERLGNLMGSMMMADAVVIRAWKIAQEFWGNERGLIPKHVFATLEANDKLIQANLAEERESGFYIRGSSQYLDWVTERRNAAKQGGKKSAEKRSKKPKQTPTKTKQTSTKHNQTQASDSGSISDSDSNSGLGFLDDCAGLDEPQALTAQDPSPTALVWRAYKAAYQLRYKSPATWNAKVAGQVKHFVTRVPVIEAPEIAAFYLQHNGTRYVASGHSVGNLLLDAEKIRMEWLTGRKVTSQDARNAEASDSLKNQVERLTKGAS